MEFRELIARRRSVRHYAEEAVKHEDIVAILTAAQQAPSWKNRQEARAYVVESPEKREEVLVNCLPDFNQRSAANAVLIVTTFVKGQAGFEGGEPSNEIGDEWGAYDLGLRDAYLVLAAADAGYDTLIMGIRSGEKIRELLGVPEEEEVVSVIALGKRARDPHAPARKELAEVVRFS